MFSDLTPFGQIALFLGLALFALKITLVIDFLLHPRDIESPGAEENEL
jgi:hypothetical protein